MPAPLPRRTFLVSLLATSALLALPACGGGTVSFPDDRVARLLDAFFAGRRSEAARLGRAHLADRHDSVRSIAAPVLDVIETHDARIDDVLQRLDAMIDGEFQAGASVLVAGWVLAPTEAALCALAAHSLDFPDDLLLKER